MLKFLVASGIVFSSLLGSIGALYLKKASGKFELRNIIDSCLSLNVLAGTFFYFLAAAIVITLLKFNDISFIYPLTAITYVFVTLLSWKFLNEKINMYKAASILLIITGAVLIMIS